MVFITAFLLGLNGRRWFNFPEKFPMKFASIGKVELQRNYSQCLGVSTANIIII